MATKKVSIFDVEGKEPVKPKLPTLNQFTKELKYDGTSELLYRIDTIWFPGQWDNYSVVTTDFRVSIAKNHGVYEALDKGVMQFLDRDTAILLQLVDPMERAIRFVESTNFGKWRSIGNVGIRFLPD